MRKRRKQDYKMEDGRGTKEMSEAEALRRLATLCSRGEHCTGELLTKMRTWGIDCEAQARIMKRLVENRYVDDERFTRLFVNDKIKFNKWGRRKIEQALWAKHVDEDIARRVLDEVDEDDYLAVLRPLIQQKARELDRKPVSAEMSKEQHDYERRVKLMKFALGRGFTMEVIQLALED